MNTKLNMGVIEDKSITYSKLADDVAESITATLTGSAPDWNAQEGETGFIKNKPFKFYDEDTEVIIPHNFLKFEDFTYYEDDDNGVIIYRSKIDFSSNGINDIYYIGRNDINSDYTLDGSFFIKAEYGNNKYIIPGRWGDIIFTEEYDEDTDITTLIITAAREEDVFAYKIYVNDAAKLSVETLPEMYLPKTILKTTPQTLSDAEKNQVKENLGISNPDWNTGEDGSGALRVMVPELSIIGEYFIEEGMITEEMVDEKLAEMEGGAAGNEPFIRMMRAYKEIFAHNAEVFAAIVEKAKKGEGCMVLLDQSPLLKVYCDIMLEMEPEIAERADDYIMSCSQVANVDLLYADMKPEYESNKGGDQMTLILAPVHVNPDITRCPIYPSNMVVVVMPDGSIFFEKIEEEQTSSGSGVVTFYMPSGETLTSEEQAKNKAAYESWVSAETKPSIITQASGMAFVAVTAVQQSAGALNLGILDPSGAFSTIIIGTDGSVINTKQI